MIDTHIHLTASPMRGYAQFVAYLHLFFLDAWNLFDLLVVLSSVIELAIVRGIFLLVGLFTPLSGSLLSVRGLFW